MSDARPLPLLDRSVLSAMTGGDSDLQVEVIEIFKNQIETWIRLMDPKAEPSQWADAAHTLKGAALSIGAIQLAAACEKAENAGRAEAPPSVTATAVLLNDLRDVLGPTLEAAAKAAHDLASARASKAS